MTMFDRLRTPFWRGVRAAALYYGVAALVFMLLKVVLPGESSATSGSAKTGTRAGKRRKP